MTPFMSSNRNKDDDITLSDPRYRYSHRVISPYNLLCGSTKDPPLPSGEEWVGFDE